MRLFKIYWRKKEKIVEKESFLPESGEDLTSSEIWSGGDGLGKKREIARPFSKNAD